MWWYLFFPILVLQQAAEKAVYTDPQDPAEATDPPQLRLYLEYKFLPACQDPESSEASTQPQSTAVQVVHVQSYSKQACSLLIHPFLS